MNDPIEVLLTSESNGSLWTCCAWDFRNGTNLMTYKGGGSANNHGLSLIKNDFIITANATKPLLHVWSLNSQDQVSGLRFVVPGIVNSLAISPDGNYLVAGIQETIYVWQICSGKMLNAISKHYQKVVTIRFTSDGSHFISGGYDGFVFVWNLTKVVGLSNQLNNKKQLQPVYLFKDHGLPVTDIHIGFGGIRSLLCSVSLDRTCKIYDLSFGNLLLNIVFEEELTCVTINAVETLIYVGTSNGKIFEFNITSPPRTKEYHPTEEDYKNVFNGHEKKVTCLALSVDSETLVSGSEDENICIWHISSKQLLRSIPHKGFISNIQLIVGTKNMFNPEHKLSLIANTNLRRMMDSSKDTENNHIVEIVTTKSLNDNLDELMAVNESGRCNTSSTSVNANDEILKLKSEINNLKTINKELFEFSVKKLF